MAVVDVHVHIYPDKIAERRGLPVIIHCGDYRYDYSHPRRLKHMLREFPDLVVDAAHFGGWSVFDYALGFLEDERCFLGPRRTRELVEAYGPDRMLFGSDFPMWNPGEELSRFRALDFSAKDYEKICWHNAERFVGMQMGE